MARGLPEEEFPIEKEDSFEAVLMETFFSEGFGSLEKEGVGFFEERVFLDFVD